MLKNNLIIFLKYPEAGKVKTRLGRSIGYEKAADVYSILTKHLFTQLSNSSSYSISVFYTPEERLEDISKWLDTDHLIPQAGSNLGEKLSNAFSQSFSEGYSNTVVIGSDCIDITQDDINKAFNYLSNGYETVTGPTNDGGYYLIGLSGRNYPELFLNIEWSTNKVFSQTQDKIKKLQIRSRVLEYYNDIDEISDINSNVIKIINSYNPDLRITI